MKPALLLVTILWATLASVLVTQATAQQPNRRPELDAAFQKGVALRQAGKAIEAIPFFEKAAALAPQVFGADDLNTAAIFNNTGLTYSEAGRPREAEAFFRRGLAIREARLGKENLQVAASLANLALACAHQGRRQEAEALLRRSVAIREARLPKDDPLLASAYHDLARLYVSMTRYPEGETFFQRCLAIQEARLGKDHVDVANTLNTMTDMYRLMGRLDEAAACGRRSVQIWKSAPANKRHMLAVSLNNLALVYEGQARYGEAESIFRRSLEIREAILGKDHPDTATALNNLAMLYMNTGRHREAEPLVRRSLQIREARLGKDNLQVASSLHNLASLLGGLGQYTEAQPLYLRALAIREAKAGKDHPLTLSTLNNLAMLHISQEHATEAEAVLQRCLQAAEARPGEHQLEVATYVGNLGSVYQRLGRWKDAEAFFRRSLRIQESRLGKDHPLTGASLNNLGGLLSRRGQRDEAERLLQRALEIAEAKYGQDHPYVAINLHNLARLHQPRQALKLQERALRIEQANLRNIFAFSSESAMYAYLTTIETGLPQFLKVAAVEGTADAATSGLTWTLRRKGVVLDTLCRYRRAQQTLGPDEALARSLGRYRALKQMLANAAISPPQGLSPEQFKQQTTKWRQEAEALEAELNRALAQKQAEPSDDWKHVTAAAVQKRLPQRSVLVEFVRIPPLREIGSPHWSQPRYVAFILTPGQEPPWLIDLGDGDAIDAGVLALRKEITDFQEKLRDCESPEEAVALEQAQEKLFRKTSAALYQRLVAPLRQALGAAEMLYVAPEWGLNQLPFEALVDGDGKYLLESYRCAYLSSGRDLLRSAPPVAKGTVVFAGPDYKLGAPERLARAAQLLGKKEQVAARGLAGQNVRSVGWRALPGAAAEAGDIQKALGGGAYGPVKTYVGADALEEVLKALPAPRVLHLATHGFALDRAQEKEVAEPDAEGTGAGWARGRLKQMDNPLLRSGIVLAGANAVGNKDALAQAEDGWVTAEEIALLDLRGCELVVLSACQTGLGDVRSGEGVYGLRRAFLYAGARTLVTSLFEVPDRETRTLMARFYGGLAASRGRLDALHGAQHELMRQRRQEQGAAHPFFWASFVLVGDPG